MKTVTTTATVGFLSLLLFASAHAEAQNNQAGPTSVGVSNITFVLHPRLTVGRAPQAARPSRPPVAVTSNFQGGYDVERIDVRQLNTQKSGTNQQRSRLSKRQQFAYVVVPKAE